MKAIEAKGLYYQVANFSFIVCLVMFDRILSCTKCLSDQLQSTQVDLVQAADLVLATKSTLEEYRTDTFWEKIYAHSQKIAELHSIEISLPAKTRQRKLPKRYEDVVILETTGSRQSLLCYVVTIIKRACTFQYLIPFFLKCQDDLMIKTLI